MPLDWTQTELEIIVSDYFRMLTDELNDILYSKTEHRKALRVLLPARSDGSIEFKHQNISAILINLSLPFIKGYLPRWNYQRLLEDTVIHYITGQRESLEKSFDKFTDMAKIGVTLNDFGILDVDPPQKSLIKEPVIDYVRRPIKVNYLEREQQNSQLGKKGEDFAMNFEIWRLKQAGLTHLTNKVQWISRYDDAAGFDILSLNEDGSNRYIEVKTTKLNKDTPIFFSQNEYNFSIRNRKDFHLYRVFDFSDTPKLFRLNGSFDDICNKEPLSFKGTF
jgi:hypothetical protein